MLSQAVEIAVKFVKDRAIEVVEKACSKLVEIESYEQV